MKLLHGEYERLAAVKNPEISAETSAVIHMQVFKMLEIL